MGRGAHSTHGYQFQLSLRACACICMRTICAIARACTRCERYGGDLQFMDVLGLTDVENAERVFHFLDTEEIGELDFVEYIQGKV